MKNIGSNVNKLIKLFETGEVDWAPLFDDPNFKKSQLLKNYNRWLVVYLINVFKSLNVANAKIDFEEIFNIGVMAVKKATAIYGNKKNQDFSDCVSNCIESEISKYVKKNGFISDTKNDSAVGYNISIISKDEICLLASINPKINKLDRVHSINRICRVYKIKISDNDGELLYSDKFVVDMETNEIYKCIKENNEECDLSTVSNKELICYGTMNITNYIKSWEYIENHRGIGEEVISKKPNSKIKKKSIYRK